MWNYLRFKKMITPFIFQLTCWVGIFICIASGIYVIAVRHNLPKGLAIALAGPIIVRVMCEIVIVFFRIYEALLVIKEDIKIQQTLPEETQENIAPPDKMEPLFDIITAPKPSSSTTDLPR